MAPNDFLIYSQISVFSQHHQRTFLLQMVETHTESLSQTLSRKERGIAWNSPRRDVSIKSSPPGSGNTWKRQQRKARKNGRH